MTYSVADIFLHERFYQGSLHNDIALIRSLIGVHYVVTNFEHPNLGVERRTHIHYYAYILGASEITANLYCVHLYWEGCLICTLCIYVEPHYTNPPFNRYVEILLLDIQTDTELNILQNTGYQDIISD